MLLGSVTVQGHTDTILCVHMNSQPSVRVSCPPTDAVDVRPRLLGHQAPSVGTCALGVGGTPDLNCNTPVFPRAHILKIVVKVYRVLAKKSY